MTGENPTWKNGQAVAPESADMIAQAFGFRSADDMNTYCAAHDRKRRYDHAARR